MKDDNCIFCKLENASCPILNGIAKCVEVEAGLALVHNVTIEFTE
jgi:hypothetical protein